MAGSASIVYSSATSNSVTIAYSAGGWSLPSNTETVTYSGIKYAWTFTGGNGGSSSSSSGTKTINGFNSGAKGTVTGSVTVTCTKTTKTTTTDAEGKETTSTSTDTYTIGSASKSLSFYTKPGSFSFGADEDDYIADILTAAKWNAFVAQLRKYRSWKDQADRSSYYSDLEVSRGDWITAKLYNDAASYCGISTRVTQNQTLISASVINALGNAVSG